MCGGGGIGSILSDVADVVTAIYAPELLPVVAGGGAFINGEASGQGFGKSLTGGLESAGTAFAGQELAPALENATGFGSGGANSLTDLLGQTTGGGSLAGAGTIGGDISNGITDLSNWSPTSGLSSLLGGTAAPTAGLDATYSGIENTAGSPELAASAGSPLTAPSLTSPLFGAQAISGASGAAGGGLTGGGFNLAGGGASEDFALPSSTGIGAGTNTAIGQGLSQDFGSGGFSPAPIGSAGAEAAPLPSTPDLSVNTPLGVSGGVGGAQSQGNIISNLFGGQSVQPNSFNYDINGNPVGNSALPVSDQFQSGGGNVGLLGSLLGTGGGAGAAPSNGTNMLNGLLKGGLGYLLNGNGSTDAIANATQQAQQNFSPYLAAGRQAENTLSNLYGNNGSAAQTSAQQNFANTPGYQFALNQGINAVDANAAAMGNPLSGNNQQAVNNYAQGTANQTYNNYVNQLQNMASGGMSAAGGAGTAGLTGAAASMQQNQNATNNRNTAIGTGLQALFPSGGFNLAALFGNGGSGNQGGLLSLFGGS